MKSSPFHIINAAAGSGKTYSLVYAYLKKLILSNNSDSFRKMLALTFTNKAVNEMKERILKSLYLLSCESNKEEIKNYRISLILDLDVKESFIKQKANRVLKKILHEYAGFEVITLDSFTHKVIRTFAKDLKIPASFEVTLDSDKLLEEMTEAIIDKAGIDQKLTKVLVDFSLSKTAELKSWNIAIDLFDFSKHLINENDRIPILSLKNKTSFDFKTQKVKLEYKYKETFKQLIKIGRGALKLISDNGLTKDDFTRKAIFSHFDKIANGQLDRLYDNKLAENFEQSLNIYNKSLSTEKKEIIDSILPELFNHFKIAKIKVGMLLILKNILNQWTPLTLIGEMERELDALQIPYNRILLSRFNEIIDNEISTLDAPYIYERLGEKYRHFFIDEFQDTSFLQWKNLIPLISSALESQQEDKETGSLLLVGDPKQAIYRWRGGDNSQFLRLLSKESPFQIKPTTTVLPKNYRSKKNIVDFNNQFFAFISSQIDSPELRQIFGKDAQQGFNKKEGGRVTIKFIEKTRTKEKAISLNQSQTLAYIYEAKASNFSWRDMVVLVRKRDQAAMIAEILQENDIPFVSSESLSLQSSIHINFLISLMRLVLSPENYEERKNVIAFLCIENEKDKNYDVILNELIFNPFLIFQKKLNSEFNCSFDFNHFSKKSIYNAIEYAISEFGLVGELNAHLGAFLENVFEFKTNNTSDFVSYLNYWEKKGKHERVVMTEDIDAVKIMTIHKAKGLEFPIVIIPFATDKLSKLGNQKVWYPISESIDSTFEWARINFSNRLKYLGKKGEDFYNKKIDEETMDTLNTLYVALTRAIAQVYIITHFEKVKLSTDKSYATILNNFVRSLGFEPSEGETFQWGKPEKVKGQTKSFAVDKIQLKFKMDSSWQNRLRTQFSYRHHNEVDDPRHDGILIHDLIGEVNHEEDVNLVIENALESGVIRQSETVHYTKLLLAVVNHPKLKIYFNKNFKTYNEQDILVPEMSFIRPDRVVKTDSHWAIIDYKTGKYSTKHEFQISRYSKIIHEMTEEKCKKFLVYIDKKILVKQVH